MVGMGAVALSVGMLVVAGPSSAARPLPPAGSQEPTVGALSPQQVEDYLEGRGMGMASPAELNGYPGPRHVLELAEELALTPDQLAQTRRLFEDMRRKAIDLGEQIVAREAVLDAMFASGTVSEARLRGAILALSRLNGELRAHHLGYHLAMRDLLDPSQIRDYQRLRGYAPATGSGGHRHEGGRAR